MGEVEIGNAKWRGLTSSATAPVRVATDGSTIGGTGTTDDPLHTLGGASGTIQLLAIGPRGNNYIGNGNMAPGVIQTLEDPNLGILSAITLRGADNQATIIRGIDSSKVVIGQHYLFFNHMKDADDNGDGLKDAGQLCFNHEDPEAALTNDQIVCPSALPFKVPVFDVVEFSYESDLKWHIHAGGTGQSHHTVTCQNFRIYPNFLAPTVGPGTVNNWNPIAQSTYEIDDVPYWLAAGDGALQNYAGIRIPTDAEGAYMTGMAPNAGTQADLPTNGGVKVLYNVGPGPLTLAHLNDGSTAGHQFICPGGVDLVLQDGEAAFVWSAMGDPDPSSDWLVISISKDTTHGLTLVLSGNPSATGIARVALTAQSLILAPSAQPAALAAAPTVTHDFDPGSTDMVVDITPNANGSILGGFIGVDATATGRGETRILRNVSTTGFLVLIHADGGSDSQFFTPNESPFVVPPLGWVLIQHGDADKWVINGQSALISHAVQIIPAVLAADTINDWNPVGAEGANVGLSYLYCSWIKVQGQVGTILNTMNPGFPGQRILLGNIASGITINGFGTGGTTGVPFVLPNGESTIILSEDGYYEIIFDATGPSWVLKA